MKKFRLNITSQEKKIFEGEVSMVVVPGTEGELGIRADHTPFISPLKEGRIRIYCEGLPEEDIDAKSGVIEVSEKGVTIIVK